MSRVLLILLVANLVALCLGDLSSSDRSYSRLSPKSKPALKRIKLDNRGHEHSMKKLLKAIGQSNEPLGKKHIVPIKDITNTQYIGVFSLGNPEQKFKVYFDTGASELTIPSIQCKSYGCKQHNMYDSSKSSTYKKNGKSVSTFAGPGILSQDTLRVADLTVANQTFSELISTPHDELVGGNYDGHFGLSPVSKFYGTEKSIIQNMIDQKLIDEPVISFYLNKLFRGNELILGGIDETRYKGDITYVPNISDDQWKIKMDKLELRDSNSSNVTASYCKSGCDTRVVTGASLIFGPKQQVKEISALIGASLDKTGTLYIIKGCTKAKLAKMPNLDLTIGGRVFTMTPKMYTLSLPFVPLCLSGIFPLDMEGWALGEMFLRPYYSVFDYGNKRIGFAQAV